MDYSNFEEFIGPLIFAIIAWLSNYFSKKKKPPVINKTPNNEKEVSIKNELSDLYENIVSNKNDDETLINKIIPKEEKEEEKILDFTESLNQDENNFNKEKSNLSDNKNLNDVVDNKQEKDKFNFKKNKLSKSNIREKLKSQSGLKEAFILKEILDKKY